MHDYSTIFFAVCQDRNGFLFRFVNFAQTQVIFYSKLTSKNIPFFFCFICAVVFNRDHCGESCAPSRNSSPLQKTVKNCCPIYKKAAEDTSTMGRVLGGIRLSGVLQSENVLLYSFLSASTIFSEGRYKNIQIDRLCDKGMLFCNSPKISFFLITAGP
jgi:hypothetical protein